MKKIFLSITAALFLILLTNSCYNDNAELLYGSQTTDCNAIQAKYGTDINQLIITKCAISGCHDANAASNPAGFTLQTYDQVVAKKDRINARVVIERSMPPTGPLLPAEIIKVACWIEGGAQNN